MQELRITKRPSASGERLDPRRASCTHSDTPDRLPAHGGSTMMHEQGGRRTGAPPQIATPDIADTLDRLPTASQHSAKEVPITYANALLVYPEIPPTYWGFNFALEFTGHNAMFPPLGLLTVAALFPRGYNLQIVDMNVSPLEDSHLEWADIVFTSAMVVQQDSLKSVIERCNRAGVPLVDGGPYPTSYHDELLGVDHFLLDEVEDTFPDFLQDLEDGAAKLIYRAPDKPDVTKSPVPRFDLIDFNDYHSMCVQFSRGCPFNCEFCDITKLFGRIPRTKTPEQVLREFESLHTLGWQGKVFLVDDNFIGNKRKALELLPRIAEWQQIHSYPFSLITEASVDLANKDPLMDAMVEAGFHSVFLGIETPNPKALVKTHKQQNTSKHGGDYLLKAVKTIQQKGLRVAGGFILGLDEDGEEVFDAQINFIQQAGIPLAMIGILGVIRGTDLHKRMEEEGRLLDNVPTGNQLNMVMNFKPEMDVDVLLAGYRRVLTTAYDPTLGNYFERSLTMLRNVGYAENAAELPNKKLLQALWKSLYRQIFSKQGFAYLKFLSKVAWIDRRLLPEAFSLAILGYHFEMIVRQEIAIHDFKEFMRLELEALQESVPVDHNHLANVNDFGEQVAKVLKLADSRYRVIHRDFRREVERALDSFRSSVTKLKEDYVVT